MSKNRPVSRKQSPVKAEPVRQSLFSRQPSEPPSVPEPEITTPVPVVEPVADRFVSTQITLSGTEPGAWDTGLSEVKACGGAFAGSDVPGATVLTFTVDGVSVIAHAWSPQEAGNTALVRSRRSVPLYLWAFGS
jgi:hypothetical protein